MKCQQGQQRPLLDPPDRHRHARVLGFELAEQPYLHEATIGPASAPRQRYLSRRAQAAIQKDMASRRTDQEETWNRAIPYRCKRAWTSR